MAEVAVVSDKEVVDFILDLYSDPRRWTKRASARNAVGQTVGASSAEACSFCLTGGINRYSTTSEQKRRITDRVTKHLPKRYSGAPQTFNDAAFTSIDDVRSVLQATSTDFKFNGS